MVEVAVKRPLEDQGSETKAKRYDPGGNEPLVKILVPNITAGALIGKGGSVLSEMQEKFGGNIRLSANREYYPGTDERVVVITGEVYKIIDFNNHIMEKVKGDISKIVLTNSVAGMLIGRGGLTIKAIQEECDAKISVCTQERATVPGERILTITGTMDERIEACRLVIEKIASEPSNMANTTLRYMNSSIAQQLSNNLFFASSGNQMNGLKYVSSILKTTVEIEMEVPEVLVGPIMGKQGQIIREFSHRSGARLKFSDKHEYAEGTTDRILKITGDMNQTQTAFFLINMRVEQLNNLLNND